MAPAAYLLFAQVMEHNPRDPQWPDRDRFVLSAGHGSMLLYSGPAPLAATTCRSTSSSASASGAR